MHLHFELVDQVPTSVARIGVLRSDVGGFLGGLYPFVGVEFLDLPFIVEAH